MTFSCTFAVPNLTKMFENSKKTNLSDLGEFKLIEHLTSSFTTQQANTVLGIGDDAAVIDNDSHFQLISKDLLLEGVHFDFSYTPFKHLGYKAVVVNLSDIVAMNGKPTQILVGIGLSSKISLEAVEELYAGIRAACENYGIDLIGGDTTSSQKGFFISVTALGQVKKNKICYRKGVKTNDLVCVSGDLGGAYTGYMLLEREKRVFLENPEIQPDMEGNDYILQRQLRPEARVDIVQLLEDLDIIPTAMIDISDGLSSELHHLAKHSNVGFEIHEDKLPIDPVTFEKARELGLDPTLCAMNGGEDYELLFTIPLADYDKIKGNPDVTVIGFAKEPEYGINLHSRAGNSYKLEAQGWSGV
jgi:thiamine-monophosphate kinase